MIFEWMDSIGNFFSGGDGALALITYLAKSSLFLALAVGLTHLCRLPSLRNLLLRSAVLGIIVLTMVGPLLPRVFLPMSEIFGTTLTGSVSELSFAHQPIPGNEIVAHDLTWLHLLILIWLVGSLAIAARYLVGMISARRLVAYAKPATAPRIQSVMAAVTKELNLRGVVRIMVSEQLAVPVVWGIVRPVVILPTSCEEWTQRQNEMVLRHELAHVGRHDVLWLNLANLVAAVQWFNPLIWLVRHRMAKESELACDDCVLAVGIQAQEYAQHLLHAARDWGRPHRLVAAGMALTNNNQLKGRIMSVLSNRKRSIMVPKAAGAMALAVTLLVVLFMAAVSLQAEDKTTEDKAKKEQIKKEQIKKEQAKKAKSDQQDEEEFPSPDSLVEVEVYPEMIFQQAPEYPDKAKQAGIEGNVWIQALIDKTGAVRKANVSKSSGEKLLDKAAVTAAYQNKFKPALQKEQPVAVWVTYKVEFALAEKDSSESGK
ncbi:MAG: TonB family protein [bacterium]